MPVDIDDTTKLSEEQRKFFSISTWSPSRRLRENLHNFRSTISTRPTAQTSPQQRAASTHFPTDEPRFSTKSSSNTAKRISFHRLIPSSSSCSTGMFIVMAPFFLCTYSTWSWCAMQGRTGAPHSVTRPRGAERAPDPCSLQLSRSWSRRRSSSISMLTAGRFSTKWRDFESTFSQ